MSTELVSLAQQVRSSAQVLANTPIEFRRELIVAIADALTTHQDRILVENQKDIDLAITNNVNQQLIARLKLSSEKLHGLSTGLRQLTTLNDPLNNIMKTTLVAEGLKLTQKTVPIGVLLIIFESRPDALVQIVSLTLYSGNGVVLKGGTEAQYSNTILHTIIQECIIEMTKKYELTQLLHKAVSLVHHRNDIKALLELDKYIDLVIPRGSNQLVSYIQKNTTIPVMGHSEGVCHIFIDNENKNWEKVTKVIIDSKTDYPSACNALEMLVLHKDLFLPDNNNAGLIPVIEILDKFAAAGVALFFTPSLISFVESYNIAHPEINIINKLPKWEICQEIHTEYGDLQCSVHIVDDINEAIPFINSNSSHHTECILTDNQTKMTQFTNYIDSASAFVNASTRFADGFRFGLGAEIGISTSRIHARGPVGLEGLVTYKWILMGDQTVPVQSAVDPDVTLTPGHTVAEFGNKKRVYLHQHE